jgi:hypothetical protein
MSEIVANSFVIIFVLFYAGLLAALFGWNVLIGVVNWLERRPARHIHGPFRHLHPPHQPRNVH